MTPAAAGIYRELSIPLAAAPKTTDEIRNSSTQLAQIALIDILAFFAILMVGFAYVWRRGDLDWVRATNEERPAFNRPPPSTASSESRHCQRSCQWPVVSCRLQGSFHTFRWFDLQKLPTNSNDISNLSLTDHGQLTPDNPMRGQNFLERLKQQFGDKITGANIEAIDPWIEVSPDGLVEVCTYLHDEPDLRFNMLN